MAEQEPILNSPTTPEAAAHARDYQRFTGMLKWSAIGSFILAMLVVFIISS
ncbi:MAG: hypothetical protein M3Q52_04190 [Pseudomonadota bacterium]|nr:hypothetical protein [Pseudomonadota bacterium]